MTLIVEDGTGLPTSNSYAGTAVADAYATLNGLPWPTDVPTKEMGLRRATIWIDTTYRARFPGYRQFRRLQNLEWPRVNAFVLDNGGQGPSPAAWGAGNLGYGRYGTYGDFDYLPANAIPIEIVNATVEAASREAATPGLLMGDIPVAASLKRERAGDTEMEYFSSPPPSSVSGNVSFPSIDAILFRILLQKSRYSGRVARA